MDRDDLSQHACREVVGELHELMRWMRSKKLPYSNWYGASELQPFEKETERLNRGRNYQPFPGGFDDQNIPWFLLWEISWLFVHANAKAGMRALDLGGSGSIFSYYLAWKGLDVTTIDIKPDLVSMATNVAERTSWNLRAYHLDMTQMEFAPASFDLIFSVCVYEHLPKDARIVTDRKIRNLLRPGGKFCITFDYQNPDREMRISSPEDVENQFVRPLDLGVVGNKVLFDNGKRYLFHPWFASRRKRFKMVRKGRLSVSSLWSARPACYTFASLFCQRQIEQPTDTSFSRA